MIRNPLTIALFAGLLACSAKETLILEVLAATTVPANSIAATVAPKHVASDGL